MKSANSLLCRGQLCYTRQGGEREEEWGGVEDGPFCKDQQFCMLLSQAKITFHSQGPLLPQILFSLSRCGTADSFGCPFIFFLDSIKYIPQ